MNKEITCRMIDGKPVVEYIEEYVPKKGDIIVNGVFKRPGVEEYHGVHVYGGDDRFQASIWVNMKDGKFTKSVLFIDLTNNIYKDYTRKATPEEEEVMLHILHENGYDLINGEVVKKRWVPKMGEKYFYLGGDRGGLKVLSDARGNENDLLYTHCFKTEEACQRACDKANELFLTLPQE